MWENYRYNLQEPEKFESCEFVENAREMVEKCELIFSCISDPPKDAKAVGFFRIVQ